MEHDTSPERNPAASGVDALRDAQVDEASHVGATPTLPVLPEQMATGLAAGVVIGAVIGALVLLPLAAVSFAGLDVIGRMVLVAAVGAVGGAAAGGVYLAGKRAEDADDAY